MWYQPTNPNLDELTCFDAATRQARWARNDYAIRPFGTSDGIMLAPDDRTLLLRRWPPFHG